MARSFNGSSDKIAVTWATVFNQTTGTSGGWFKTNASVSASNMFIFSSSVDFANKGGFDFVLAGSGTVGAPILAAWDSGGTQRVSITGSTALNDNKWHHIVAVFNQNSGGTNTLYVDGSSAGTNNSGAAWSFTTTNPLQFGIAAAGNWQTYSGSMADWFYSSAQLTAGEISALANGARPYNLRGIVGYWPFDGLQSPEPDYSGNNNNGTLTGTANASGPPVMQFTPRWNQFNTFTAATTKPFPPFNLKAA